MKYLKIYISTFFLMSLSAGVADAQETGSSDKYHPFLSDNFNIGLGIYRPSQKRTIGADLDVGSGISDSLDVSNSQTTGLLNFRWRFTKNWSFQGTYWKTDSDSEKTLTADFEWGGVIYPINTSVRSELDTSITRLFWGRSFFRTPSTDWGVGLGLHVLDIDATLTGEFSGADGATATAPLPNLGIWYMYSWSPKWVVTTRLDWLDITFEEFSGSLYDLSVGVNYQMSDHFGIGLAVNAFRLDVQVDGDWSGDFVNEQIEPRLNVTWNW